MYHNFNKFNELFFLRSRFFSYFFVSFVRFVVHDFPGLAHLNVASNEQAT